jgi:hypothetical protein
VSHLESATDGEVEFPEALVEALMSFGLGGFDIAEEPSSAEGLEACPPLGIRSWVHCSWQERPKGYLEALCMEI